MKLFTRDTSTSAWVERRARLDGISVIDSVNERGIAELSVYDEAGTLLFQRGQGVRVQLGATALTADTTEVTADDAIVTMDATWDFETIFTGFVDTSTETRVGLSGARQHALECVDLHYLADKRIAARAYTNETAGGIVRDLITTYLSEEGITEGTIEDGPTILAYTINYKPVSEAILDLARRAGYFWRIHPNGELDFLTPDPVTAPALALETAALADTINVVRHQPGYRNRQWVRGGRARSLPQVEVQKGDGLAYAFVIGLPIAAEPTIEVSRQGGSWVVETVGAAGIQDDRDWTYTFGSTAIRQNLTRAVLADGDRVRITYEGLFNVVARVDDASEQTAKAALEGGSGLIEDVQVDRSGLTTVAQAFDLADELLEYWARPAYLVRFASRERHFRPGGAYVVSFGEAGIASELAVVQEVETFQRRRDPRLIVTLAVGPLEGSWVQWLANLSRRVDTLADDPTSEVDIITTLQVFTKLWVDDEVPNIFFEARAGTAVAGAGTFPEFEVGHRVRYLAWFFEGVELGRRVVTFQTGAETSEVVTTVVMQASDGVGAIDEFAWFGGWQASLVPGSGLELDRQAFVRVKTDVEQIQVRKIDTKWGE